MHFIYKHICNFIFFEVFFIKFQVTKNNIAIDYFLIKCYWTKCKNIEYNKRIVRDFEALALSKVFGISLDELYAGADKELNFFDTF